MIIFFFVCNVIFGVILMNYEFEAIEDHEQLQRGAFFMQAFRISLGDFLIDNMHLTDAHYLTVSLFYFFFLVFVVM